jgi:hypothetical protein
MSSTNNRNGMSASASKIDMRDMSEKPEEDPEEDPEPPIDRPDPTDPVKVQP